MERYVIERNMPGAGKMSSEDAHKGAARSLEVLKDLGPGVQWVESFVTDDKVYCVYVADSPELIRKHAELSGFPADRISAVRRTMDPTTTH